MPAVDVSALTELVNDAQAAVTVLQGAPSAATQLSDDQTAVNGVVTALQPIVASLQTLAGTSPPPPPAEPTATEETGS